MPRRGEVEPPKVPPRPPIPGGVTVGQVPAHLSRQIDLNNSFEPACAPNGSAVIEPSASIGTDLRNTRLPHAQRAHDTTTNRGHPRAHGWSVSHVLDQMEEAALCPDQRSKDRRQDQDHTMFKMRKHTTKIDSKDAGYTTLSKKRGTEESKKHAKRQAGKKPLSKQRMQQQHRNGIRQPWTKAEQRDQWS